MRIYILPSTPRSRDGVTGGIAYFNEARAPVLPNIGSGVAFEPGMSVSSKIVPAPRRKCGYIDYMDLPSREVDFKLLCNKYSAF